MKTLHMMVGLPRSGKSTVARTLGFPIVNPDSIRLALHGQPFIGLAEPFVWAIAKVMVRSLFIAGHNDVILDATNLTVERRNEWRSKAWNRVFYYIPTSKEVCIERAIANGQHDLVEVIERMDATRVPPQLEEEDDYTSSWGDVGPIQPGDPRYDDLVLRFKDQKK